MPIDAETYFKQEVIKSAREAKTAIKEVTDMPAQVVKAGMRKVNDSLHKSSHPITHLHLASSIDGKTSLKHVATSKAAAAILASPELKKLAQKNAESCFKARLLFKSNRDLARAFYEATVQGEVTRKGKQLMVKAVLIDRFDFRLAWVPKELSVRGSILRYGGNVAYVAQEMNLLKPVKLTVELAGPIK